MSLTARSTVAGSSASRCASSCCEARPSQSSHTKPRRRRGDRPYDSPRRTPPTRRRPARYRALCLGLRSIVMAPGNLAPPAGLAPFLRLTRSTALDSELGQCSGLHRCGSPPRSPAPPLPGRWRRCRSRRWAPLKASLGARTGRRPRSHPGRSQAQRVLRRAARRLALAAEDRCQRHRARSESCQGPSVGSICRHGRMRSLTDTGTDGRSRSVSSVSELIVPRSGERSNPARACCGRGRSGLAGDRIGSARSGAGRPR